MQHQWIIMGARCEIITTPTLAQVSIDNVGIIIETFVGRQFPNTVGH